jgi:hypothetical protein
MSGNEYKMADELFENIFLRVRRNGGFVGRKAVMERL